MEDAEERGSDRTFPIPLHSQCTVWKAVRLGNSNLMLSMVNQWCGCGGRAIEIWGGSPRMAAACSEHFSDRT